MIKKRTDNNGNTYIKSAEEEIINKFLDYYFNHQYDEHGEYKGLKQIAKEYLSAKGI